MIYPRLLQELLALAFLVVSLYLSDLSGSKFFRGKRIYKPDQFAWFPNPGAMMGRSELFGTRNLGYILVEQMPGWLRNSTAGTSAIIGCTYQCVEDSGPMTSSREAITAELMDVLRYIRGKDAPEPKLDMHLIKDLKLLSDEARN